MTLRLLRSDGVELVLADDERARLRSVLAQVRLDELMSAERVRRAGRPQSAAPHLREADAIAALSRKLLDDGP